MGDQYFLQEPGELEKFIDFIGKDLENVKRVINFCDENELDVEFKVHSKTETAEESAEKTDIELGQVVKTLVFKSGDEFIAVLCPGDSRVSEERLEELTSQSIRMANPEEVKEHTGYIVGGVSPFDLDIEVFMEESLMERDEIKPAAGSRVVGITVAPEDLKKAIEAEEAKVI